MDVINAIHTRRSVRRFTDAEVSEHQVERLLRAAMAAPSAMNQQPWRFVVVRDAEMRAKLAEISPYAGPVARANLAIAVLAHPTSEKAGDRWAMDCAAATENLLLAAHASGLGTCWIGVHPEPDREAAVADLLGVPSDMRVLCLVAVGVPEGAGADVDRYNPEFVHAERWS